ncbi:hypothetical protein FOZ62_024805 [Perkinsus olseni]|uniref:Protein CASP n=1 Tax=Perkinsus olseni TaxID=32597 RepID=A0A7J6QT49_PEROL|nr:hypothetical protein FOZ62_024805 [Perkinsus olseni]
MSLTSSPRVAEEEQTPTELWRSLNFPLLLEEMSNTVDMMADCRARSLESKKQLAEDTKAFQRRLLATSSGVSLPHCEDSASPSQWDELLKSYQSEIDALSRRAKHAETSFNKLFQLLKPLPDPVSAADGLGATGGEEQIDEFSRAIRMKDDEIVRLTTKLHDLDAEFSTLTNQAVTVRRLRETIKAKDDEADEKVKAALSEQAEEFNRRLHAHGMEVDDHKRRLQQELDMEIQRRKEMEDLIAKAEEERLQYSKVSEDSLQALASENETLAADVDRLTAEVEALRTQLNWKNSSSQHLDGSNATVELNLQQERARSEALEAELAALRAKADADRDERQNVIDELQRRESRASEELRATIERLEHQKKEVMRLRAVEEDLGKCQATLKRMNIVEYSTDPSEGTTEVERMLLGKVRNLEAQLAPLRVKASEADSMADELRRRQSEVTTLKESLDRLEKEVTADTSPSSSLPYTATAGVSNGEGNSTEPSLLDITRQQRDHLRTRVLALETERDSLRVDSGEKSRKCDRLYADNVRLLEQKKYWQSVSGGSSSSVEVPTGRARIISELDDGEDDVEMRYMPAYMQGVILSPFETFKTSEREKRLMKLPTGERMIVQVLTQMVGNRVTRIAGGVYLLALHLLVFIVLYKLMHLSTQYENIATTG